MTRFVLYSHDTYGLGHFRRSALLASGIAGAALDNEALIVTGSPRAQAFATPERVDTIKLPSATKDGSGRYQPRKLGGPINDLVALRSALIASAVESYVPDVIVIDHAPIGMGGELLPMLNGIERLSRRPRLVLGLRDIIDEANKVDGTWHRDGVWDALDRYDDILVYGDPKVLSTATELGLARRTRANLVHTGYVAPAMPEPISDDPFVLVTAGGGGDGQALLRTFLDAAAQGATSGVRTVLVTGPLLSAARRAELLVRAKELPMVDVIDFCEDMRSLISSAIGVISMAGYNTVVEELASNTPALLVPRRAPRLEQTIRASRLAPLTQLYHCPLEDLTPSRIRQFITDCQRRPIVAQPVPLELGGVARAVSVVTGPSDRTRTPAHA